MALIKGISVTLYDKVQMGTDAFNAPIFEERPVAIENVLVSPAGAAGGAVVGALQLHGKRAAYELCIPKEDTHTWVDREVAFFGERFCTVGFPETLIEALTPLRWNKKVLVERYG